MAINNTMPSINNFLSGFSNGLPGMKDFRHASRLYLDDNQRLAPKQKWLFHVVFTIDNTVPATPFTNNEQLELNMLVKSCELPKYDMGIEEKLQYNKKVYIGTRIKYSPVTITFHDDQADTVNAFWKSYYEYHIADARTVQATGSQNFTKDDMYNDLKIGSNFGMDNATIRKKPLLKAIEIFALHKKRFSSFTLINPIIGSFSHDTLDQTDGQGLLANTMQIYYETVLYDSGVITATNFKENFANLHYDKEPSPLSVLGRGTTSIFGPGGVLSNAGSVIKSYNEGNYLGAAIGAINTYNNAKKIKAKEGVKEELKGIVKGEVMKIGTGSGVLGTSPIGGFFMGAALAGTAIASNAIGNQTTTNNRVTSNPILDTQKFLSPTESFNLLQNNEVARDKVAASLYYKTVGSRKGLSINESEIEYTASSDSIKNIYRSRALTDTTKLVTEGYLQINRATNQVNLNAEKASL